MRDCLLRLRSVFTLRTLALLAAALLLLVGRMSGDMRQDEQTQFEKRIGQTLSQMAGAGNVRVVIKTRTQRETQGGMYAAEKEYVCGAIAVAQGADDPLIRLELQEALCALLELPPSSVSVVAGGD